MGKKNINLIIFELLYIIFKMQKKDAYLKIGEKP